MIHPLNRNQFVLGGVIGFVFVLNLILPYCTTKLFSEWVVWNVVWSYLPGAFLAQICLLGAWAALGVQPAKLRLPLSGAAALLDCVTFVLGYYLTVSYVFSSTLLYTVFIYGGLTLAIVYVALSVIGLVFRRRIACPETLSQPRPASDNQITLRYLFICTGVFAFLIMLMKLLFQLGTEDETSIDWPWSEFFIISAQVSLMALPWIPLMLLDRWRVLWFFVELGAVAVVFYLLEDWDLGSTAGLCATSFGILFIIRRLGYRLVRLPKANKETVPPVAVAADEQPERGSDEIPLITN